MNRRRDRIPKPGIRHQRYLNVDFTVCGLRRAEGHLFAANSRSVTCPDCQARHKTGRQKAAAKLEISRPVFCKLHNKVHTVTPDTTECAPGAWKEPTGGRLYTETP